MKATITIVIASFVLAIPGLAAAQSAQERAQEFFDEGAAHYVSGEYARAIVSFRKAFTNVENPIFLYNIAAAERNLGQCDKAIATAERAVAMPQVDPATSSRAKGIAQGCRAVLAAQGSAALVAAAQTGDQSGGDQTGGDQTGDRIKRGVEPGVQPPNTGFGALGWTGVALTVAGTGALVAGSVMGVQLDSTYDTYSTTDDPVVQQEARDELESGRPVAFALLGVGTVAAATGLVLVLLELGDDETSATVGLNPDPSAPSVTLRGRF